MKIVLRNAIVVPLLMLAFQTQGWAQGLDQAEFRRLHELLQPNPAESWRTIPWQTGLLDAQQMAAQQRKPIFIWAMDGHPLGCT
jgi:hypothetical protein